MSKHAPWDRSKGRPEPIRALNRIPEAECHEPLVDISNLSPRLRIHRPQVIPYLRETVAEMSVRAAESLPEGYSLGVVEAWRPVSRQQRIYDWLMQCAREAFPHRDHAALRRTVCRYVAPTDQKAPPGHSTGAAIDVHLLGPDGEAVDVNSPYPHFRAASTYTLGLSPEAQRNRMLLVETMLSVGFSNCRDEWWHYSYGDAGWAVRMDRPVCFYGRIDLDESLYREQEELWIEAAKNRTNPFLS
ncbi:MAG: hypothetical protein N2109_01520 [Fimbriimonadales bacterium]|nr:hypothetical protein [Fimbriimonadales bacterium]